MQSGDILYGYAAVLVNVRESFRKALQTGLKLRNLALDGGNVLNVNNTVHIGVTANTGLRSYRSCFAV